MIIFMIIPYPAIAQTPTDARRSIKLGTPYYANVEDCNIQQSIAPETFGNYYQVGDSITVGVADELTKALNAKGYSGNRLLINGDNSRSIDSAGNDGGTSGIEALDEDKEFIADSEIVVVALGTNGGTDKNNIKKYIEKIKSINSDAAIYWVNIGVTRNDLKETMNQANESLKNSAQELNYKIIDWQDKIGANDKDDLLEDKVHPNAKGYEVMSKLIANRTVANPVDGGSGESASNDYRGLKGNKKKGSTGLGGTYAKAIWSFFINEVGLSDVQSAAAMGNLWQETGGSFDPSSVEGGNGDGHGIAQWSFSRKDKLLNVSDNMAKNSFNSHISRSNVKWSDLDYQLWFLKDELDTNSDFTKMIANLKQENDIQQATYIFHGKGDNFDFPEIGFEASGDTKSMIDNNRVNNAKKVLKKFAGIDTGIANGSDKCRCEEESSSGSSGKPVIFIDPGHGPENKIEDPATGILDYEFINDPEVYQVWDVAQDVKKDLEKAGYEVVMSKKQVDEKLSFRQKANRANESKAELAVSIHTTPGVNEIYYQKVGLYREYNGKKDTYKNSETAKKSIRYANKFQEVRQRIEEQDVSVKINSYDGRGLANGNIATIMLWSDIPWVYLEKKQDSSGSINNGTKKTYAKSIVEGVKKTIPSSGNTETDACGNLTSEGDIVQTLKDFIWNDQRQTHTPRPKYKEANDKAHKAGRYVGSYECNYNGEDCGAFVTRLMQDSGFDKKYNTKQEGAGGPTGASPSTTPSQWNYLEKNWEKLGIDVATTKLRLGDVAINASHTWMYIGKIDGIDGDSAQASLCQHMPTSKKWEGGGYTWYRKKE